MALHPAGARIDFFNAGIDNAPAFKEGMP